MLKCIPDSKHIRTKCRIYFGRVPKSADGGNVLTAPVLSLLPPHDGPKVIYAAASRLGAPRLQRECIVFKQTPYALDL